MPSRKVLGSVIRNLAHSFMSTLNYVDHDFVSEHLRRAVERAKSPNVRIDVLRGSIEPPAVGTEDVALAVAQLPSKLEHMVVSGGATMDMVRTAEILIDFDLDSQVEHFAIPGGILRNYKCEGRITDDRGRTHNGAVPVWWHY